jgi:hypothetical protein
MRSEGEVCKRRTWKGEVKEKFVKGELRNKK